MTLKNRCVTCDHVIEAPDSMRGREIACPRCEATNVLLSAEDARRRTTNSEDDHERARQSFLNSLESRRKTKSGAAQRRPSAVLVDSLAIQDKALLAGRRLKDISVYLVFFAYALLLISLGGALAVVFWANLALAWKVAAAVSCAFCGVSVFVVLKLLSDTVQALADLTELGRSVDQRLEQILSQPVTGQADSRANERLPA